MRNIIKNILIVSTILSLFSCSFLDQDEVTYQTKEYQFSTFERTKQVCAHVYTYVNPSLEWIYGTQSAATDDAIASLENNNIKVYYDGTWSSLNCVDNKLSHYYEAIAQANYFLENCPNDFPETVNLKDYKQRMIQLRNYPHEVRFLRAYFHFELLKRYNNIVIIDHLLELDEVNSLQTVDYQTAAAWIVSELDKVIEKLPVSYESFPTGRTNRVTKGAAMALKSRVLLYASSPLNNTKADASLWHKAAVAAHELIKSGEYSLVKENVTNNFKAKGYIWGSIGTTNSNFEKFNFPFGYEGAEGGVTPTQNLAEAYDLIDGTPFDWNNPEHRAIAFDKSKRDPRFAEIFYTNGDKFKGSEIETFIGGKNALPLVGATQSSYYLKKFIIESTSFVTGNSTSYQHIYPIFRYAEAYLNYAEALFELTSNFDFKGSLDGYNFTISPREAINAVRSRAGVGQVKEYTDFREAIRKERRVELAFENHRIWDIRRWMIGEETCEIYGLLLEKKDGELTITKQVIQKRIWDDKYYFYPYPAEELFKNKSLIQNKGW